MPRDRPGLAKISRPRLHDVLARTRLFNLLDKSGTRPVVWLSAQPGAGKTTLIAGYLEARKRPTLWYQLDAGDADPAAFFYHLRLAAGTGAAGRARADAPLPLLTAEHAADPRAFARRFFRELFDRLEPGSVIVFDDFHEVPEDSVFHDLLCEAIAQLPAGLQCHVLSRTEPPGRYGPLLAADAMALVGGETLRHTLQETRAIARKRGIDDGAAIEALHRRSNGWAAGLTLLLAPLRERLAEPLDESADSLQHVFGYFAQRVLDGRPEEERRLLMQLAFLPFATADMACRLTGSPHAPRLLERLYRHHLFTDRRRPAAARRSTDGTAPVDHIYHFHDLFGGFLRHQALRQFGADACREIRRAAAGCLEQAGFRDEALTLNAEAGAWDAFGRLLAGEAERLLAQGRRNSVIDWLERMPASARADAPWLDYWEARAHMHAGPERAIALFEAAQARFERAGDRAGQLACGAGVLQTLWYARLGWSEIVTRVARLEAFLREPLTFPSPGVAMMTYAAVHAALAFCVPSHPDIGMTARRLIDLLGDEAIDWDLRLATATHLMAYLHNAADFDGLAALMARVDERVDRDGASALNRAFWHVFRAMHDLRLGAYEPAAQRFDRAAAIARDDGLVHAEFAALQFRCYLELLFRHADAAQALLARMETHAGRHHRDGEMNYWTVRTLLAQQRGDARAAQAHAERALAAIEAVGAPYFMVVFPVTLAAAFADAGEPDRSLAIVAASRDLARGTYLEVMEPQWLLEEAYAQRVHGDIESMRAALARGLGLAARSERDAAYVHRAVALKPVLLIEALRHGIEPGLTRRLIRRWRVPPPARDCADFPWPIRVRTLGTFGILVEDAPIEFGRKVPRKALGLFKAVIAHGGSVAERVLQDLFWPDEDGDAAAKSLAATVHRLRVLLGSGDAMQQQGGIIAIDRDRVWVDAWAFEETLAGSAAADADALDAALESYRGSFLPEEEGETWPVQARERLRSRFIHALAGRAAGHEAAGRLEAAIALYLRGIDADPLVEPFYQGLMRCYARQDRKPEALSAFRRLRQTLSVSLGLAPSAESDRLYRALLQP